MRALLVQLEQLAPPHFVLAVAGIGAILQGMPSVLLPHTAVAALSTAILMGVAAILLWWVAVRRRQFSVWRMAWQLVVALALADTLALGLSLALASIQTHGDVAQHLLETPVSTFLGAFVPPLLILGGVRFLLAAALLSLGRLLPGSGRVVDAASPAWTHREAVT